MEVNHADNQADEQTLTAATTGLRTCQRRSTRQSPDKLADAALSSTPDEFNRKAKQLVDQAKNDWGIGRAIEDRKRSEINTWHDKTTGMGRINAWLDPERFSQFRSLLDAETTALANDRKADGDLVKKDKRSQNEGIGPRRCNHHSNVLAAPP